MNAPWSSRSLGSRAQHAVFYALIRAAGTTVAYVLLFFVVTWYTLRPSVRRRSRAYLERRFPGAGRAAAWRHAWKLQWSFGQCLVDRAAAGLRGGFIFEEIRGEDPRPLLAEGNGVILLSAHTGCLQAATHALAEISGLPVIVLQHSEPDDVDKQIHEHTGQEPPYRILRTGGGPETVLALLRHLRQGGVLCLMGDRVEGSAEQAVRVSFLGAPVRMPCLAYRLASASGAPVLCVFARRTGPLRGSLHCAECIRPPAGLGRQAQAYRAYAQRFASALERFVLDNPYRFFNFYDLWES
ncbi:MAG: lipid A biosynthesis acyltransferase [Desulfovibrio sp.]|nr:lipid A biosynthesis acyltransferase [Desulfovibrio sp.]